LGTASSTVPARVSHSAAPVPKEPRGINLQDPLTPVGQCGFKRNRNRGWRSWRLMSREIVSERVGADIMSDSGPPTAECRVWMRSSGTTRLDRLTLEMLPA
jgi:hypothetical protein